MPKTYLGDGVYADLETDVICLTTQKPRCTIYLKLEGFEALQAFVSDAQEPLRGTAAEREFDARCNEADTRRKSGEED